MIFYFWREIKIIPSSNSYIRKPLSENVLFNVILFSRNCTMSAINNMQVLQSTYKTEEDTTNEDILSIVADKYCRIILETIMDKPKSVMEIAAETKAPLSTVYRRIQTLYDSKLILTSGTITDEGKRLFLYKSKVKGINSKFGNGKIEVELIPNQHFGNP